MSILQKNEYVVYGKDSLDERKSTVLARVIDQKDPSKPNVIFGISSCHPMDNFDRKIGVGLARRSASNTHKFISSISDESQVEVKWFDEDCIIKKPQKENVNPQNKYTDKKTFVIPNVFDCTHDAMKTLVQLVKQRHPDARIPSWVQQAVEIG